MTMRSADRAASTTACVGLASCWRHSASIDPAVRRSNSARTSLKRSSMKVRICSHASTIRPAASGPPIGIGASAAQIAISLASWLRASPIAVLTTGATGPSMSIFTSMVL